MNDITIEDRLDEAQNEYFGILTGFLPDGHLRQLSEVEDKTKFVYNWERMKDLQRTICYLSDDIRMKSLEKAKQKLEDAFTPRIKSMLSKKVLKEMEDDK